MANIEYVIGFLLMGGVIGWLASLIVKGRGLGLVGDILLGVLGALVGGGLFRILGQSTYNPLGGFVTALVGAVILLALARMIKRNA